MLVSNVKVYGLFESMVASGYPMKADMYTPAEFKAEVNELKKQQQLDMVELFTNKHFKRGYKLANAKSGSGHDCWLKGVIVQMDVKAPQYFWQQLQRYHFVEFISSQSKLQSIQKMELEKLCMLSTNYEAINNAKESVKYYDSGEINIDDCLANIPMGLEYTARMTTNYLQLKTIYHQRKHHRSKQWKDFCEWIETLPYAHQLIITSGVDK